MPDDSNDPSDAVRDPEVEIGRALRAAMDHPAPSGTCQDCGGMGVVPAMALSREHARSLWKDRPTCAASAAAGVDADAPEGGADV